MLPQSDISQTGPSIASKIVEDADSDATEFLFVLWHSAISDFVGAAPFPVGQIFAKDGPVGIVVAIDVVGADLLMESAPVSASVDFMTGVSKSN